MVRGVLAAQAALTLLTSCVSWAPAADATSAASVVPAALATSNDPRFAYVAIGGDVRVVDTGTGVVVAAAHLDGGSPSHLAVSPDGALVVVGDYYGALTSLAYGDGRLDPIGRRESTDPGQLVALAFSRDGAWLVSVQQGGPLELFARGDLGRPPMRVGMIEGVVDDAFFGADGELVVARRTSVDVFRGPPFVPVDSTAGPIGPFVATPAGDLIEPHRPCEPHAWSRENGILACISEKSLDLCSPDKTCRDVELPVMFGVPRRVVAAEGGFLVAGEGPFAALVSEGGDVRTFFIDAIVDDAPVGKRR